VEDIQLINFLFNAMVVHNFQEQLHMLFANLFSHSNILLYPEEYFYYLLLKQLP